MSSTSSYRRMLPSIVVSGTQSIRLCIQSDHYIGSLLWLYMISSCLTELMSSPGRRTKEDTSSQLIVHHQLLTASRSQRRNATSYVNTICSPSVTCGDEAERRYFHSVTFGDEAERRYFQRRRIQTHNSICVSRHNPNGDPLR